METPLFFKNKNYNLFGVLHEPDETPSPRHSLPGPLGIVFCHPFAEEKLISHRVMVNLARNLVNSGMYCLRFDFMGHGDSDGSFEDATLETRLSDIKSAIEFLKTRANIENVGLLGVRFGASLAALINAAEQGLKFLILISPIIEGKSYIENCLRSNLTTQMTTYKKVLKDRNALIGDLMNDQSVNIDGYMLTKTTFQQIRDVNLLTATLDLPQNVLLIQTTRKEHEPIHPLLLELQKNTSSGINNLQLTTIKDHFFWADSKHYHSDTMNITGAVSEWLNQLTH